MEALDGAPRVGEVGEGLAHAHEHDVRHPAVTCGAGGGDHLFDDLTGREVTVEAGLAGGAEAAGHGAAGLRTHTDRRPVGVEHEHGLDLMTVVGLPQPLEGLALVGVLQLELVERQRGPLGDLGPQRLGNCRDLVGVTEFVVEALPDLVDPVVRLTVAQRCELGAVEVVERGAGGDQVVDASIVRL